MCWVEGFKSTKIWCMLDELQLNEVSPERVNNPFDILQSITLTDNPRYPKFCIQRLFCTKISDFLKNQAAVLILSHSMHE